LIRGNNVGTDLTGTHAYGFTFNRLVGIHLEGFTWELMNIEDNVVAAGRYAGAIRIENEASAYVLGNFIGVDRAGNRLNNFARYGIQVQSGARVTIGFDPFNCLCAVPNVVAHATGPGIAVLGDTTTAYITQNSIFANTGLGIDLAPIGIVNANDPGDLDGGPNSRLNAPELDTASATEVRGHAGAGVTVEVFLSVAANIGDAEAQTLVGTATAASDGSFLVALPPDAPGKVVTAIATDRLPPRVVTVSQTSELSAGLRVPNASTVS
jgi:hypothetical protein